MLRPVVSLLVLVLFVQAATADVFSGVPEISDGDTVLFGGVRVRLLGMDAPEDDQVCLNANGSTYACGVAAREAMVAEFGGKAWRCLQDGMDERYHRPLVHCSVGDVDVDRWMVLRGWALGDPRFQHPYDREQGEARAAMRGLWSGAFHAPWDWRHHTCATTIYGALAVPVDAREKLCPRTDAPPSPACAIKGNLASRNGCIYHRPGDASYFKLDMRKPGRRWFCSEAEAESAGCRRAHR